MLGLLIHIKPYTDESLPGYLYRLAQANGLPGSVVVGQLRENAHIGFEWPSEQFHENCFWPSIAAELTSPQTRPAPLWNIRRRRFCGKCLAEKFYWRAAWDLSLVTACRRHSVRLQDQCPHCGKHLRWGEHAVENCQNCGRDLSAGKAEAIAATSEELWMTKELTQRMIGSSRHCDRHLKCLDLESLHELAFRFGCYISRPETSKPKKIADSGSSYAVLPIALAAAHTLDDWPHGFFRSLDQIRSTRGDASQWKLRTAFGPIYREIYAGLTSPSFQFVRDAFENYLQRSWHAPLAFRHRSLSSSVIRNHQWLPISDIAARLNLDPALIARLADAGQIPSQKYRSGSGRNCVVVELGAIEKLSDELRTALTAEQAANFLGLTKSRIEELIQAKILAIWGNRPVLGTRWFIDSSSVNSLFNLGQAASLLTELSHHQATVDYLLRHQVNNTKDFTNLVAKIIQGEVAVCGVLSNARRICDWVVDTRSMQGLLNQTVNQVEGNFTVIEVANELSVKQEVAYALVRHGLIKSRTIAAGKKSMQMVRRRSLEAFRQNYIFGSELAKALEFSPKALVAFLCQKGIFPVSGPNLLEMPCRQYLWRRSKRVKMLISRAGLLKEKLRATRDRPVTTD